MKGLRFFAWILVFLGCCASFWILFQYGPQDFKEGARQEWEQLIHPSQSFQVSSPLPEKAPSVPREIARETVPVSPIPKPEPSSPPVQNMVVSVSSNTVAVAQQTLAPRNVTSVTCPECQGQGVLQCRAGCENGMKLCPGPCLKLSQGFWQHMDVPGHSKDDLWQKFDFTKNGKSSWTAYNQGHVGHLVEKRDGIPTDIGECPTCHGTTKVTCDVCNGTGKIVCEACGGKKVIELDPNNPFQTKDGRIDPLADVRIREIVHVSFPFLFIGKVPGSDPLKVKLSPLGGGKSYVVGLNDPIPDPDFPSFVPVSLTEKSEEREDPSIKGADGKPYLVKIDASELTVRDANGSNFVLIASKQLRTEQLSAKLVYTTENRLIEGAVGATFSLKGHPYQIVSVSGGSPNPEVHVKRLDLGKEWACRF